MHQRMETIFSGIEDMVGVLRAIEEEMEGALKFAEDIINTIKEPLLVLGPELKVLRGNVAFYDVYGGGNDDIAGCHIKELQGGAWDNADLLAKLDIVLEKQEPLAGYEMEAEFPGGVARIVNMDARPMYKQQGQAGALVVMIQDITERKHLEQAREDMERIARHDLKSPLSGAISLLTVLATEAREGDELGLIKYSLEALHRGMGALDVSMDLLKIELGTFDIANDQVDLPELVDSLLHGHREQVHYKRLNVIISCEDKVGECKPGEHYVHGSSSLMHSIYGNIVKNAIEASPKGADLRINMRKVEENNLEFTCCNVGDVPMFIRDRFFDKYVTAEKESGTGLGTYVAKQLVDAHKGKINMDTGKGKTTLTVIMSMEKRDVEESAAS